MASSVMGSAGFIEKSFCCVRKRDIQSAPGALGKALFPHASLILYFVRLGMEPRVLCMLGKLSIS